MVTLRVESLHGVRGVIDNLQLALLVIVAISAVKDTICVSCLVTELTVISGEEESFQELNYGLFWRNTQCRCHIQICSCGGPPVHGSGKPPSGAEHSPPENR